MAVFGPYTDVNNQSSVSKSAMVSYGFCIFKASKGSINMLGCDGFVHMMVCRDDAVHSKPALDTENLLIDKHFSLW